MRSRLTPAGEKALARFARLVNAHEKRIASGLSAAETRTLIELLEKVRGGARRYSRAPHDFGPSRFRALSRDISHADILRHFATIRRADPDPQRRAVGRFRARLCRCRFEIVPAFCHSQGRICQGGFLTGMVDTAMANAAIAKGRLAVAVPTLELKISFLEAMGPASCSPRAG